jgi:hypothetical protein
MVPANRVLAVSFADQASAHAAADLIAHYLGRADGVHVAPLGHPEYPSPSGGVLTARFEERVIEAVRNVVEAAGGTVEMDVAEDRLG